MRYRGLLVVLSAILFATVSASTVSHASVIHHVDVRGDIANVSSSFPLTSKEGVNQWDVTLNLPEGVDIRSLHDSQGPITYTWTGGRLKFETNEGPRREKERVEVNYTVRDVRSEEYSPVDTVDFSLFGFKNETTKAEIECENIISWYTPFQSTSQRLNSSLRFKTEGPLPIRIYTSPGGQETEHYHYFIEDSLRRAEKLFPIIPYVTGISSPQDKFPIVFLNGSKYDSLVNKWSAGRYKVGGLIVVRRNLSDSKKVPTILHETTHGFNARLLKWDETRTSYFDEGMAKFVEFLAKQKMEIPQPQIFGGRTRFKRDGERYYYKSRMEPEDLWDYYSGGDRWMMDWNPWEGESDYSREFGYAYSELMIRKHTQERGLTSLRNVSKELLEIDRRVNRSREKWNIFSRILENMRPCHGDDREELERCLKDINSQKFEFPDLDINVTTIEGRERTEINITEPDELVGVSGRDDIFSKVEEWIYSIVKVIRWILGKR